MRDRRTDREALEAIARRPGRARLPPAAAVRPRRRRRHRRGAAARRAGAAHARRRARRARRRHGSPVVRAPGRADPASRPPACAALGRCASPASSARGRSRALVPRCAPGLGRAPRLKARAGSQNRSRERPRVAPAPRRRRRRRTDPRHPGAGASRGALRAPLPEPLRARRCATILSAQCTDERVNMVTPTLFARYPDAAGARRRARRRTSRRSSARPASSAPRRRACIGFARALVADHGGEVPRSMEAMVKLPGVGPQDGERRARPRLRHRGGDRGRHPRPARGEPPRHRARRRPDRGRARSSWPSSRKERWTRTTDLLIFHGRKICDARRPLCGQCPVFALCRWPSRQAFAMGKPPRAKGAPGSAAARASPSPAARSEASNPRCRHEDKP